MDWDNPPRPPETTPELHLAGFDGPLDLLLDLAERARIDLARISIADLVDQFVAALVRFEGRVPLERRADWLVLAARLLLLRARLFFAADLQAEAEAEAEVARERERLRDLQTVRATAAWLGAQPQLGHDVFARGGRGRDPRVASYMRLMEACLTTLRGREEGPLAETVSAYRLSASALFEMGDILRALRVRVAAMTGTQPLDSLLPALPIAAPNRGLLARSARASTFVGALEMCREGLVGLDQQSPFGPIMLASFSAASVREATAVEPQP